MESHFEEVHIKGLSKLYTFLRMNLKAQRIKYYIFVNCFSKDSSQIISEYRDELEALRIIQESSSIPITFKALFMFLLTLQRDTYIRLNYLLLLNLKVSQLPKTLFIKFVQIPTI